jgi:hypothetical protein
MDAPAARSECRAVTRRVNLCGARPRGGDSAQALDAQAVEVDRGWAT